MALEPSKVCNNGVEVDSNRSDAPMNEQERKDLYQKTFDTVAAGYDNPAMRFFVNSVPPLIDLLDLDGNEKILDVATGTGHAALELARHVPRGEVCGIDFSKGMLAKAEEKKEMSGLRWDFNALGTIFELLTHTKIFEEFNRCIAVPLQMEDFKVSDGRYVYDRYTSIHPAYTFVMSTRDLARFGLLYLNMGKWKNEQIVDQAWVNKSTAIYSYSSNRGVGFKWTKMLQGDLEKYGTYQTTGSGGHRIMVIPKLQMVFVHRVDTFGRSKKVSQRQIEKLLLKILQSYKNRD